MASCCIKEPKVAEPPKVATATNGSIETHGKVVPAGFSTPQAAREGPRETLLYLPAIDPTGERDDYLVTIDVDPSSPEYGKIIHRLPLAKGVELHHMSWNACSSCTDKGAKRSHLILPAVVTSQIFAVDTLTDPRAPRVDRVVDGEEIKKKTGLAFPHTSHCLATGEVIVSLMGTTEGEAKGGFVLLDSKTFEVKGLWGGEKNTVPFGYDMWYKPKSNVMVSTAWGSIKHITQGFNPAHVAEGHYGSQAFIWDWEAKKLIKEIDLGAGTIPLEVRFLHNPDKPFGFIGNALSSDVSLIYKDPEDGEWKSKKVITQEAVELEGWVLPKAPPLITDILISLDDKNLFISNWLRGDISQYDIQDPHHPKLVGQIFLGGIVRQGSPFKLVAGLPSVPEVPKVRGVTLTGGPQMIQLSRDGERLYVTNSLFSVWDKQFYPEGLGEFSLSKGSQLIQLKVNVAGGLEIDESGIFIDFGAEPGGPVLAHEVRLEGGDSSSDIWG